MLFSSFCQNFDTLKSDLCESFAFRASSLFVDIPEEILKCACVDYSWDCTKGTTTFTGIPPRFTFLADIKSIISQFVRLMEQVICDMAL